MQADSPIPTHAFLGVSLPAINAAYTHESEDGTAAWVKLFRGRAGEVFCLVTFLLSSSPPPPAFPDKLHEMCWLTPKGGKRTGSVEERIRRDKSGTVCQPPVPVPRAQTALASQLMRCWTVKRAGKQLTATSLSPPPALPPLPFRRLHSRSTGLAYICEGLKEQRRGLVTLVLWNNQLTHTGMAYLGMTLVSRSLGPGHLGGVQRSLPLPLPL